MRSLRFPLVLGVVWVTLAAARPALAADAPAHIALFQTSTEDASLRDLAAALDPVLSAELDRNPHVQVTERPALDLPAMQLALDCVAQTAECLRSVTDQAHVEGLLTAVLRSAGNETQLTLFYFDARGVGTMKGATRKHSGDNLEQATLDDVPGMLQELFGAPAANTETPAATPASTDDGKPAPAAATQSDKGSALPIGPIALGVGGALFVGIGGAFGIAAKNTQSDYGAIKVNDAPSAKAAKDKLDSAKQQALLCNLGIGIGAAAVVGSVIWWFLSDTNADKKPAEAAALSPLVGPHELGLSLRTSFTGGT